MSAGTSIDISGKKIQGYFSISSAIQPPFTVVTTNSVQFTTSPGRHGDKRGDQV